MILLYVYLESKSTGSILGAIQRIIIYDLSSRYKRHIIHESIVGSIRSCKVEICIECVYILRLSVKYETLKVWFLHRSCGVEIIVKGDGKYGISIWRSMEDHRKIP